MQLNLQSGRTLEQEAKRLDVPVGHLTAATGLGARDAVPEPLLIPAPMPADLAAAAKNLTLNCSGAGASTGPSAAGDLAQAAHSPNHGIDMTHEARLEQNPDIAGRPPARMLPAAAGVVAFREQPETQLADGVHRREMSNTGNDPDLSIHYLRLENGASFTVPRPHGHQVLVLRDGTAKGTLNGQPFELGPNDMIFAPHGATVKLENTSGRDVSLVAMVNPREKSNPLRDQRPLPETTLEPRVIRFADGEPFKVPEGVVITERLNGKEYQALSVDHCEIPPGVTTSLHGLRTDERYIILEGKGVMEVGGQMKPVEPGDVVRIPHRVAQRITTTTGAPLEVWLANTGRFVPDDYVDHHADAISPHSPPPAEGPDEKKA